MAVLKNRAKMSTSTTGTGTITLGSAESGYQTFADAGVANGDVVRYVIEDGNNWEIGTGTYTSTGTTLSRTVSESSNSDAAINLSGSATVFIGATAEDIPALYADNDVSATAPTASGNNSVAIGDDAQATSTNSIAIGSTYNGSGARATTGAGAVAIGGSRATGAEAFAANIGSNSSSGAQGTSSIAMGFGANANATEAVSIGKNTTASGSNAVAIGQGSQASGADAVAIGYESAATQSYSFAAAISGGLSYAGARASNSIAMGYRSTTNNLGSVAIGYTASASGNYSIALGDNARTGGTDAIALGKSRADGTDSFAAAITNNTSSYGATGANSIAMGYQCKSSADSSSVALGRLSIASANYACAIGNGATASAANAFAFCDSATASGFRSVALGRSSTQGISGKHSRGAYIFSSVGDAQEGKYVLLSDTTDATAEALTTTNGAASATNQVVLPNNSAYAFHGTIVARQQAADGTACAAWKVEGLIRREGSANTTVLVNSATTVLDNTPSWGMALSADTTNGCLKIQVTGAASTDIRWVATIHTSEVTYA